MSPLLTLGDAATALPDDILGQPRPGRYRIDSIGAYEELASVPGTIVSFR
jgi:hypothetical protein